MLNALRYYWIISKGYRLRPWASPYIQWRMETFFGHEAANLDARKFFALMWRERARMERFLEWVATRRRAQHTVTRDSYFVTRSSRRVGSHDERLSRRGPFLVVLLGARPANPFICASHAGIIQIIGTNRYEHSTYA
jgi:hypothetical protein